MTPLMEAPPLQRPLTRSRAALHPRPARPILHLLGMDHTKLTYFFHGRHIRLTDVYGDPIRQLVA